MENTVTTPLLEFILIPVLSFFLGVILTIFAFASIHLRHIGNNLRKVIKWNLTKPKKS